MTFQGVHPNVSLVTQTYQVTFYPNHCLMVLKTQIVGLWNDGQVYTCWQQK
ncbi:MAG: hypothetical protein F6J87_02680 [Spirulina sp. SIO3F2]|nr:hypothetical protein [Spirulina sp. SIO3F2]